MTVKTAWFLFGQLHKKAEEFIIDIWIYVDGERALASGNTVMSLCAPVDPHCHPPSLDKLHWLFCPFLCAELMCR